jgi:L,D-transpeptidase-like protein/putative peptidoglycan binding protein
MLVASSPAQVPPASVTLEASRTTVSYGSDTKLSGFVSSGEANETVEIVDELGTTVTSTVTFEDGKYVINFIPEHNMTIHAEWESTSSSAVTLRVKVRVHARLTDVRLFDKATVSGTVKPGHDGQKVTVTLKRNGRKAATKKITLDGQSFSGKFEIKKAGKYKATAVFDDSDHLKGSSTTGGAKTRLPSLQIGSSNVYVKLLEKQLKKLHYFIQGVNDYYDERTSDAVLAFNKVNGRSRVGTVNAATWKAMASPKRPHAKTNSGFWIEVDQTKSVFYTVQDGKITNILHVSTGAGGGTRDGTFRIYKKGGQGAEFYPSYFDGPRAFHVWADVPPTNASHGCIRLPYWTRNWYWNKTPIGTNVRIYH